MEFALLGTLEVRDGGRPVVLGRPKQQALLALLLLHANRVVARARLIDELWGEAPPETAVKAVQVYISQLRKILPTGMLVTRAPGYMLIVDPERIDVLRFERLAAEAGQGDPAHASSLLREALALWRGSPLEEFREEPFARVERARLNDLRFAALEERIEADLALGRHHELTAELEALIAEQPQRERLRAQLMLARYRCGRQAEALGAYHDAWAALNALGLEPSAALRGLQQQILNQDPALELPREERRTGAAALPGPLIPASPFPFVGRAAEVALLRSLLDRAEGGEGAVVLVAGEAGAGKTRLIREFAHDAAAKGALVLYGASDAVVSTPYQPLREWVEFLLHTGTEETLAESLRGADSLALILPELARVTGSVPPPLGDPGSAGYVVQTAAVDLLRRLGRAQPLLVVADDLHWADADTLQLLRRTARAAPEARLLVVAAYRNAGEAMRAPLADAIADVSRLDSVTRLPVGRLTAPDLSVFIHAAAGAEAPPQLTTAIEDLTDGTPLLVCELWRELVDSGIVEIGEGILHLSRPLDEIRSPEHIRDVVGHRVAMLPPATGAVLELAAVAGPTFDLRVLSDAAEGAPDGLAIAVDDATRARVIEALPEPAGSYRFTHELVRRAVYDRITPLRRAQLHLRVAEALERLHESNLARVLPELAHHFTLAAPISGTGRAIDYNLRAADAAIGSAAYEIAAARLRSALQLEIDDPRERTRIEIELAYLLGEMGRPAEGDVILAAILTGATGAEERGAATHALLKRVSRDAYQANADLDQWRSIAEQALSTFAELGDAVGLAEAGWELASALRSQGRVADAHAVFERALADAEESGALTQRRRVAGSISFVLCTGPTPAGSAIRRCEELRESSRDDRMLEAVITRNLAALYAMTGRFDEAREALHASSDVLDELNIVTATWAHRWSLAEAKDLLGDRAGAEQELAATWERFRDIGGDTPDRRAMHGAYRLALLRCDAGRWDEAERCLEYAAEVPVPPYYTAESAFGLAARGRLAAHQGRLDGAIALARAAVELADRSDNLNVRARIWSSLAAVEHARGNDARMDAAVAEAIRLYEQKGNVTAAGRLRSAVRGS